MMEAPWSAVVGGMVWVIMEVELGPCEFQVRPSLFVDDWVVRGVVWAAGAGATEEGQHLGMILQDCLTVPRAGCAMVAIYEG